jgi:hypothetical protein
MPARPKVPAEERLRVVYVPENGDSFFQGRRCANAALVGPTKFCKEHTVFYLKRALRCPLCVVEGEVDNARLR